MKKRIRLVPLLVLGLLLIAAFVLFHTSEQTDDRQSLVIAMPRGEFIRSIDTNYYKLWLEEQTGLSLSFLYLEEGYTADYLENAFASGDVTVDAFFSLDLGNDYLTALYTLESYGEKGYIVPLNDYLDGTTNLERIFSDFEAYHLQSAMTASNGEIYFMPGLDASRSQSTGNILWLNKSWLSKLKLPVPQTTEQLHEVLAAFRSGDPNGNGLADEIPLCGTVEADGQQLYHALIHSFVYCDPHQSYLLVDNGEVLFAPMTDPWRDAMQYLNALYADGLIDPLLLQVSSRAFSELANNPADVLGGFTANHITDVLLQNSPEVLSGFIHVAPLEGPDGIRSATAELPVPTIAGVISASCKNPQAVFELFDLMLTEEAFLIGRYGEENVDWKRAGVADMDFYGENAKIRILNHLSHKMQNKQLSELGPFYAYPQYADSITFRGLESDQEYINARAVQAYEPYMPSEQLGPALYLTEHSQQLQAIRSELDAYTQECIEGFMTGRLDPDDDAVWQRVIRNYDELGLEHLLAIAQASYDRQEGQN